MAPEEFRAKLMSGKTHVTTLPCPSSCGPLTASMLGPIELDWCPHCNGVWFDEGEIDKAIEVLVPTKKTNDWGDIDVLQLLDGIIGGLS